MSEDRPTRLEVQNALRVLTRVIVEEGELHFCGGDILEYHHPCGTMDTGRSQDLAEKLVK